MILKIGVLSKMVDWRLPLYKSVKLWLRIRTKRRRKRVRNVSQTEEGLWRSMKEVKCYQEGPDAQWGKKVKHSRICTVPWQGRGNQIHRQSVIQVKLGIPGLRTSPQSSQFTNTLLFGVGEIMTHPASGPATERNPTLSGWRDWECSGSDAVLRERSRVWKQRTSTSKILGLTSVWSASVCAWVRKDPERQL